MSEITEDVQAVIRFCRDNDLPPTYVNSKRMASRLNDLDAKLGIKRRRAWAMGDNYYVVWLPSGPRVVMYE